MVKIKTLYVCQECGANFPKWQGKCSECDKWNSLVEETMSLTNQKSVSSKNMSIGFIGNPTRKEKPQRLQEVAFLEEDRITTSLEEFNRVLGGGIVPGSMVLLGGDPGIGKSTILLQTGFDLATRGKKVLYVTGEESLQQVRLRARRMEINASDNFYLLAETDINYIIESIKESMPDIAVIDSIQAIYDPKMESSPGSVSQVRNTSQLLLHLAKTHNIAMMIIGHVTKEGSLAGPKVMEHMVDTVMYFEGERYKNYRLIRAVKNRFGATNEVGLFDMTEEGLKEISNPSGIFLAEYNGEHSGSCVISTIEGTRPLLIELQALAYPTHSAIPRRSTIGFEYNRLNQILAILEKRVGINLSKSDVLVNVVGGLKISEPAADLGVALAVISSIRDIVIHPNTIVLGELGLGGEVRMVNQIESRLKEAAKLGFKKAIVPNSCLPLKHNIEGFELIGVSKLIDAIIQIGKEKKEEKLEKVI
ncbi:MAG: DNA repair protein RadA [Candidatus Sericytochromatia bacterium]|nr:DNA repair protein RadA [Candidatus Sericytochromatia bacterium]